MAMKKPDSTISVKISAPKFQSMQVTIKGTSSLIFNRFSEKAKNMIAMKQAKDPAASKREKRDPDAEYKASYYKNAEGKIAFPALSLKQALVGAVRFIEGKTMVEMKGLVYII